MKYCKSCKDVFHSSDEFCAVCRKKLRDIADLNEPVRLCVIGGTERTMLCGLLNDAGIPYLKQNDIPQGVANEIVTGYDVKLNNIAVLVPFQALPEAIGLLGTIETVENKLEPMLDEIEAHISHLRESSGEKESAMSPAVRTTVKVLSTIAFLILVALVVLGTDKITEFIKGLFGG